MQADSTTPTDPTLETLQTVLQCGDCDCGLTQDTHKEDIDVLRCPDCGDIKYRPA